MVQWEDMAKYYGGGGDRKTTTNIRRLEITDFHLSLPIDLDFDKKSYFCLVDKNMANFPLNEQTKTPYKYLMNSYAFQTKPLEQLTIHPYSYFDGYWFSLEYFKDLDSEIRAEFSLKTPLSPANAKLKAHIKNTLDSIFLHIRRGDYLQIEYYENLCRGKYYEGSICLMKSKLKKPHIFIFSNDIAWCKKEFLGILSDECKEGVEFEFVANNGEDSAIQEMELMRSCQNAIIANSTFSWWASYLINNPQKIVAMPNNYNSNVRLSYSDTSLVYDAVVLVDSHTGEIKLKN